ncbi:MAG: DNA polymerase III subunit delta' [Acidobacteria bacterium]|nr:DNA polymerase III subunit delta' [Acidobacteriota bacterium]
MEPLMWDRLVGQEAVVRALRAAAEQDALGHAYLFAGPQGVGRMPAAFALAASANCPERGCGACPVCRKVLRRAHPDVHLVAPEGAQILVGQVRAVREEAFRSPIEGRTKVFVVEDAERMNAAAANALLKVLEEPPAGVLFVLITEAPEDLPPTVASRCRRLDFAPLGSAQVREVLAGHHGIDPDLAEWAGRVAGNLARALRLARDPDAPALREAHLELPGRLARAGPAEAIRAAGEVKAESVAAVAKLRATQEAGAKEHAEVFGDGRGTAAARKRLEDRHRREAKRREMDVYEEVLSDLASFYRDLLLAASGAPDALVNREVGDRIVRAAPRVERRWLLHALDRIEWARRAISRNASPALVLEALFMELGAPRPVPVGA